MDIFSGINNVMQKTQTYDTQHTQNINKPVEDTHKSNTLLKEAQNQLEKMDKDKLKKELEKLTDELNKALNPLNTTLKFKFNDKISELTVQVVDTHSDKVIREYPPKEALELMEKMREVVGMLFDKKG